MKTVKAGEHYEGKTGRIITVKNCGLCYVWDDSKPTIIVENGGVCVARDRSNPLVTVEDGGEFIDLRNKKERIK